MPKPTKTARRIALDAAAAEDARIRAARTAAALARLADARAAWPVSPLAALSPATRRLCR